MAEALADHLENLNFVESNDSKRLPVHKQYVFKIVN